MARDAFEYGKAGNDDKAQKAHDAAIEKEVAELLKEAATKKVFIPKSTHNPEAIRRRIDDVEEKRAGKGLE